MPFDLCRIGQLLRETREEKGIPFEEVSNTLLIRKQFIGAIEAGDWDNLPHPVYVKGYVTQYAVFLGILDLIKSEVASGENEPPAQEPEAVTKHKKVILRGWKFRKKEAVACSVMAAVVVGFLVFQNLPKSDLVVPSAQSAEKHYQTAEASSGYQSVAVSPVYRPVKTNPSDEGGGSLSLETKKLTFAGEERAWARIGIEGLEKKNSCSDKILPLDYVIE